MTRRRAALAAALLCAAGVASAAAWQADPPLTLADAPVDGLRPSELSGLAWDADEQRLLAVSDRGRLFQFTLQFAPDGRLQQVLTLQAQRLAGAAADAPAGNAEGLALLQSDNGVRGDTQLLVVLEDGPSLRRYTPRGELLESLALPPPLADRQAYRSGNSRLEALAVHPRHGLVTAPQRPLKAAPAARHTLFAADGMRWSFAAHGGSGQIKALESTPEGRLLVLERSGNPKARRHALRELDPAACATAGGACVPRTIDTGKALAGRDNFEGLARLPDGSLLLVSDDGGDPRVGTRFLRLRPPATAAAR